MNDIDLFKKQELELKAAVEKFVAETGGAVFIIGCTPYEIPAGYRIEGFVGLQGMSAMKEELRDKTRICFGEKFTQKGEFIGRATMEYFLYEQTKGNKNLPS